MSANRCVLACCGVLLCALISADLAIAQSGAGNSATPATPPQSKVLRAPVGHRQPTAADVPKDIGDDPVDKARVKREQEIDKTLKICRDC